MFNNQSELVKEFNKASDFFKKLNELKESEGLVINFKLYKAFGELSVKTDIPVEGPAIANPKLDVGISKTGQFMVYGDYNKDGSKRAEYLFEDAKHAAVFVARKAARIK